MGRIATIAIPGMIALLTAAVPIRADDIVTWVGADGVTHFGNARLAPSSAEPVEVAPANAMVVPDALPPSASRRRGPAAVVLEKEPNRELIGWRGHQWNVRQRGHR